MSFDPSPKTAALIERLTRFMQAHVYPNETRFARQVAAGDRWQPVQLMEELKARGQGRRALEPFPARI